ncbi:hypothetical protein FIBSPDRAFT_854756, partial [Athelia psychrophila]
MRVLRLLRAPPPVLSRSGIDHKATDEFDSAYLILPCTHVLFRFFVPSPDTYTILVL